MLSKQAVWTDLLIFRLLFCSIDNKARIKALMELFLNDVCKLAGVGTTWF